MNEYATLQGKRDTADVIQVIDLTIKILSWTFSSGPNLITSVLMSREISPARARQIVRKVKPERSEA